MISTVMQKAINEQINKELYSAYLYLAMAAYFEDLNLPGFAHWMYIQEGEERVHAMKFYKFLVDRGAKVQLKAIDAPAASWKSPLEAFKEAREHEAIVTSLINSLYELALSEKDYPSQVLLQWYIDEQVEEEKNAADNVCQLELAANQGAALLLLDRQFGKRGED